MLCQDPRSPHDAPAQWGATVLERTGTVVLDDRAPGRSTGRSYLFCDPEETIVANTVDEIPAALTRLDERLAAGRCAAGFLSYDAGLALDKAIASRHQRHAPLIWLGVYSQEREWRDGLDADGVPDAEDLSQPQLNIADADYLDRIARVKEYILAGDVYQINFTCKFRFRHATPASRLFARLRAAHPVCHSAFVNTGEMQVISLSPELFLRREGRRVLTRPMKGTLRRGRWFAEDEAHGRALAADPKNRAENVMIVDLMRNDLGRVCELGSVRAPRLFQVERYASLWQMTSNVEGVLREGVTAGELLRATFPPGSITGAPKIRAMEIIDELERESRGVYCGAIGLFRPGGDCLLNVAIRTIVQRGGECELGVGGGIVADSDSRSELAETRLKGKFLFARPMSFRLLETLLWRAGDGYFLLEEHLNRMRQSAAYFGWDFPEQRLREALADAPTLASRPSASYSRSSSSSTSSSRSRDSESPNAARVRLLLDRNGACETQWTPLSETPPDSPLRLSSSCLQPPASGLQTHASARALLSPRRTDPSDIFLYHKTTRREAYDADWRAAHERGYFDLLYLNTRGELTEGAITNVLLELGGQWFTPPLDCGLLPGVWRAQQLAGGAVRERVLTLDDLRRATRVVMGNSVRGATAIAAVEVHSGSSVWTGTVL